MPIKVIFESLEDLERFIKTDWSKVPTGLDSVSDIEYNPKENKSGFGSTNPPCDNCEYKKIHSESKNKERCKKTFVSERGVELYFMKYCKYSISKSNKKHSVLVDEPDNFKKKYYFDDDKQLLTQKDSGICVGMLNDIEAGKVIRFINWNKTNVNEVIKLIQLIKS